MKVVVLGSGSKGNATYIEAKNTKILIDCGISFLQIRNRLAHQGIELKDVNGIFITHEHGDHIGSLPSVLKKLGCPVYMNEETYLKANQKLKNALNPFEVCLINKDCAYEIGDLTIVPIGLSHDSENCFGYLVKENGTFNTFGSVTDTGFVPEKYFRLLSSIKVLLFESNHDVEMLQNSSRPWDLIRRILSDHGHLSNVQAADTIKKFYSSKNQHIILAHISEECNTYDLAKKTLEEAFDGNPPFMLSVAKQYEELPIITIEENENVA